MVEQSEREADMRHIMHVGAGLLGMFAHGAGLTFQQRSDGRKAFLAALEEEIAFRLASRLSPTGDV